MEKGDEVKTKNNLEAFCNLRMVVRKWQCLTILCESCHGHIQKGQLYGRLKDGYVNVCLNCCEPIGVGDDPDYPTKRKS
ncbi:MAG: hypothetical protein WC356_04845 [Candidatus Micrarchaeia archaeon]|jgi:hypothetical protein